MMQKRKPRLLIMGAGVIGSLYALRFKQYDVDVTLLARGQRLQELRQNGLRYNEKGTVKTMQMQVIERLNDDDLYDFVFVAVRYDQILPALEALKNNNSPNIVTLTNTVGYDDWTAIVGERLLPGFPGGGGDIKDGVLHAAFVAAVQGTIIGEMDGAKSERLLKLTQILKAAKLKVELPDNILAFHMSHAAFVAPNKNFYTADGMVDLKTAQSRKILHKVADDVKRNVALLKRMGIPIADPKTRIVGGLSRGLIALMFRMMLNFALTRDALLGNHAVAARDECFGLDDAFRRLEEA